MICDYKTCQINITIVNIDKKLNVKIILYLIQSSKNISKQIMSDQLNLFFVHFEICHTYQRTYFLTDLFLLYNNIFTIVFKINKNTWVFMKL